MSKCEHINECPRSVGVNDDPTEKFDKDQLLIDENDPANRQEKSMLKGIGAKALPHHILVVNGSHQKRVSINVTMWSMRIDEPSAKKAFEG